MVFRSSINDAVRFWDDFLKVVERIEEIDPKFLAISVRTYSLAHIPPRERLGNRQFRGKEVAIALLYKSHRSSKGRRM